MQLRLVRYGRKFWAVYENDALLCVTVYKKGARAVIDRIGRSGQRKVAANTQIRQVAVPVPRTCDE
jgi:hypothetical protein